MHVRARVRSKASLSGTQRTSVSGQQMQVGVPRRGLAFGAFQLPTTRSTLSSSPSCRYRYRGPLLERPLRL